MAMNSGSIIDMALIVSNRWPRKIRFAYRVSEMFFARAIQEADVIICLPLNSVHNLHITSWLLCCARPK